MSPALAVLGGFFPPNLSGSYILGLAGPLAETVGMAAGGMLAATLFGLPLALMIGARLPGSRLIYTLLAGLRAIPDLTLAILCVVVMGLGPAAGLAALAIFYTAMVGKVFADLFLAAERRPLEALQSTGAPPLLVGLFGLLPLASRDLLSMGCYSFECAVRAAVIVGAVGGGGLGTELVGALSALDYRSATTILILLVLVVRGLDELSFALRRRPKLALALFPVGAAAFWTWRPDFDSVRHGVDVIASMFPPSLPPEAIGELPRLLLETLFIAGGGTLLAAVLGLPLALASARNIAPWPLATAFRLLLGVLRAAPEAIWGLIFVALVGVGPMAGVLALGVHSAGVLGKLFAESCENVRLAPVWAVQSTGAATLPVAFFATLPLASGAIAVHALFRFEWNLRAAAAVGMIGAGGVGQALYNAQQLFFYQQTMAYVLLTWVLVAGADWLSDRTRQRFGLACWLG
jgi:phosphonate transport system permease protein